MRKYDAKTKTKLGYLMELMEELYCTAPKDVYEFQFLRLANFVTETQTLLERFKIEDVSSEDIIHKLGCDIDDFEKQCKEKGLIPNE